MAEVQTPTPSGEGETIPYQTRSKYTIDDNILNHELRRKLWDGQLPIKVDLSINDVFSIKMPPALYVRYTSCNLAADHGSERELLLLPA